MTGLRTYLAATAVLAIAAVGLATSAAAKGGKGKILIDPACLASAPWMVNVKTVDLRLNGCRSIGHVGAPNADGWRRFDKPDGGYIETRLLSVDGKIVTFEVLVNGGGSADFRYKVSGNPNKNDVLKAGTFSVTSG